MNNWYDGRTTIDKQNGKMGRSEGRELRVGDVFQGRSHVDMINQVLGTHYKQYMRCAVPLPQFGGVGIAWFVNMDSSEHGTRPGYLWSNTLSADGKTIVERYVGTEACAPFDSTQTYRLAFQLDPAGTGNRYKCKFVGYFRLVECAPDYRYRKYALIQDTYRLSGRRQNR